MPPAGQKNKIPPAHAELQQSLFLTDLLLQSCLLVLAPRTCCIHIFVQSSCCHKSCSNEQTSLVSKILPKHTYTYCTLKYINVYVYMYIHTQMYHTPSAQTYSCFQTSHARRLTFPFNYNTSSHCNWRKALHENHQA